MYDEFCDCSGGFACWITDCYLSPDLLIQDRLEIIAKINLAILDARKTYEIISWKWLLRKDQEEIHEKIKDQGFRYFGNDIMTYIL